MKREKSVHGGRKTTETFPATVPRMADRRSTTRTVAPRPLTEAARTLTEASCPRTVAERAATIRPVAS